MTTLRALVAAGFLLAVMGSWYPSRLAGPFSSVLARPTQRRSPRADHTSGKLSWCRRRSCHEPQTKGSHLSLWRRRNSLLYAARIPLSGIDCQAMRAIWSERPAELLIPPGEVDAELCPNEKMVVDESRFFNVHGCGGMDQSFQSHPVIWAHPEHAHRDPRRVNSTDYRQPDVDKGLLAFQP
jgi:hypothetical protein